MNVLAIAGPVEWSSSRPFAESPEPWTLRLVTLALAGKAYVLFAFLFGTGFALQADRIEAQGASVTRVLSRRYLALGLFGAAHAFVLWSGDILLTYALLGFVLLPLRRCRPGRVLRIALVLLFVNAAVFAGIAAFLALMQAGDPAEYAQLIRELSEDKEELIEEGLAAYGDGSAVDIFRQRASEFLPAQAGTVGVGLQVLAMLLLGLWAVRSGIFSAAELDRPRLKHAALLLGVFGAVGEVAALWLVEDGTPDLVRFLLGQGIHLLSAPALAFGACAAAALLLRGKSTRVTAWLAPLGRVTLTAYLMQSAIFTTVFYSYGGGFYGRTNPSAALALAAAVWLLQLFLARWWLARFRMGPAEALWRRLTYLR